MRTSDLLHLSSRQVMRKRRRYVGPFLGIVLGIASVVTAVTVGDVILKSLGSNLAMLGSATSINANLNLDSYDCPNDTKFFSPEDVEAAQIVCGQGGGTFGIFMVADKSRFHGLL